MSSGPLKRIILSLLDDEPQIRAETLDWNPRLPPLPTPRVTSTAAVPQSLIPKALLQKKSQVILRSSTSLKDMMSDYNKPHRAPLMKSGRIDDYLSNRSRTFKSDKVEHINLSQIPGKILRPS